MPLDLGREFDWLGLHPVLPVGDLRTAEEGAAVAQALRGAGCGVLEVAMRNEGAVDALRGAVDVRGVLVGAGTVLDERQVDAAASAGARFIVSPGLCKPIVARAKARGLAVIPGVATATDVTMAVRLGLGLVKLFPAAVLGGLKCVNALAAPFPQVRFLPTGGIRPEDVPSYLAHPAVAGVGGSWFFQRHDGELDLNEVSLSARRLPAITSGVRLT